MNILFDKSNHFNLANLATFFNIASGLMAIYYITHGEFVAAVLFAWAGGVFDILDGKIARKYNLSSNFGIQLDSYADFLSFVLVPCMFIYFAIIDGNELVLESSVVFAVFLYYIISALRRLISFNLNSNEGEVAGYFVGIPTPLGAILLWIIYLVWYFGLIPTLFNLPNQYIVLFLMVIIAYMLNSKLKIKHF